MDDEKKLPQKKWWQSLTIQGAGVGILGTVAGFFGLNIDAEIIKDVTTLSQDVAVIVSQVTAAVGMVVAIWGRVRAETTIQ